MFSFVYGSALRLCFLSFVATLLSISFIYYSSNLFTLNADIELLLLSFFPFLCTLGYLLLGFFSPGGVICYLSISYCHDINLTNFLAPRFLFLPFSLSLLLDSFYSHLSTSLLLLRPDCTGVWVHLFSTLFCSSCSFGFPRGVECLALCMVTYGWSLLSYGVGVVLVGLGVYFGMYWVFGLGVRWYGMVVYFRIRGIVYFCFLFLSQ